MKWRLIGGVVEDEGEAVGFQEGMPLPGCGGGQMGKKGNGVSVERALRRGHGRPSLSVRVGHAGGGCANIDSF